MAPRKSTKRNKNQTRKESTRKIRNEIDELDIEEDTVQTTQKITPYFPPETIQNTSDLPIHKKYEAIEKEEREAIAQQYRAKVANSIYFNQNLPVRIHVAAPEQGRFTREVETTIGEIRNIELVINIVKKSLPFEIKGAGINVKKAKFAGLMTYGPTNDFSKDIIHHTRGLFVDDGAYKKWWLGVNRTAREDGNMLKIAVILDEGIMVKKLEWNIEDKGLEIGCRNYEKMQEQIRDARAAVGVPNGDDKAELKALTKDNGRLRDLNKVLVQELARLKVELADEEESVESKEEEDDSDYVENS